ncbi:MAG: thiamine pyrophosphate-dependent enzyme, partial [Bacteroidota bacterium]
GDFRSGYYRDQTFMFASGLLSIQEFFAQLYATPDVELEPSSAGRCMNGHFSTRLLEADGSWKDLTKSKNSSADISPTGGQMPRLLGLALASKVYRRLPELAKRMNKFTSGGTEVAFGTIGDASTSEGLFFETINAAGVMQVPMAVSVWDDGYGISVPAKYQTTKQNIAEVLSGFAKTDEKDGYIILTARAWDYPALVDMYERGIAICREQQIPVLFHVTEVTQPQGHSTSGSHERYKTPERLAWEDEFDCIRKFRNWILENALGTEEELDAIQTQALQAATEARKQSWSSHLKSINHEKNELCNLLNSLAASSANRSFIELLNQNISESADTERKDLMIAAKKALRLVRSEQLDSKTALQNWLKSFTQLNEQRYSSHLHSESTQRASLHQPIEAKYNHDSPAVDGREVLQANWDVQLQRKPELLIFGEDVGHIGGVNQT